MDRLRQALGDEQLTYLGYSYGTTLGSTYAELFPDKVRALVLDGASTRTPTRSPTPRRAPQASRPASTPSPPTAPA
jgi:pimeloyl-ACP methyl ester carboxylesterase